MSSELSDKKVCIIGDGVMIQNAFPHFAVPYGAKLVIGYVNYAEKAKFTSYHHAPEADIPLLVRRSKENILAAHVIVFVHSKETPLGKLLESLEALKEEDKTKLKEKMFVIVGPEPGYQMRRKLCHIVRSDGIFRIAPEDLPKVFGQISRTIKKKEEASARTLPPGANIPMRDFSAGAPRNPLPVSSPNPRRPFNTKALQFSIFGTVSLGTGVAAALGATGVLALQPHVVMALGVVSAIACVYLLVMLFQKLCCASTQKVSYSVN